MKKIAIIGASYLQLPLIKKATELNIEVHCFAWPEGAVCKDFADFFYPISILDKEVILKICTELKIDGITTIATDMAVPTICYIAEKLSLISNSYESSIVSTNKALMRQRFLKMAVNSPKFIETERYLPDLCSDFDFPLIVKPVDRSGSRGVMRANNEVELAIAIKVAVEESFIGKCVVEEYIDGIEVSVEAISWEGNHYILNVTDKVTTGTPNFVELAHHQPSELASELIENLKKQTILALDALSIKYGASHSEFKVDSSGKVHVIEVGARMGGDFIGSHLVELSTGYDFLKGVIEVCLNNFNPPSLTRKSNKAGVYFLCKETEGLLPCFMQENDYEVEKVIQNTNLTNVKNSNDRSGYLIYQSNKRINLI